MAKFCQNCGSKLNEEQDICLGCGTLIKNDIILDNNSHKGYKTTTGVIMIIIGVCMILGASDEMYEYPVLVYSIPGLLGIVAGILSLCSKNNLTLLFISGIVLFVAAIINFLGIIDVSIFMILATIFGIFNIIYSRNK